MIKNILTQISDSLASFGITSVYTAFDNIPVSRKESRYIVVSVNSFETAAPIFQTALFFSPTRLLPSFL